MARSGRPQHAKTTSIPSPIGGVNAQASLSAMAPTDVIFSYNLVASELGLRTREGYSEASDSLSGDPKTIIPFSGPDGTDKIFVCTTEGIWDSTTATSSKVLSFSTTTGNAGYGVYEYFENDSGDTFIFYADAVNGLFLYTASSDTWAAATGITGITVADVRFVAKHKQRIWLALADQETGYYLPVASIAGAATAFYFGGNFKAGGDLAGIYTWTRDGGDGLDDFLILVSRGGDVLAYQGSDPSDTSNWSMVGGWSIGQVPAGRRFAVEYGGELFILSSFGMLTLSALFRGVDVADFRQNPTAKITRIIRTRMATESDDLGWELVHYPLESLIVVQSPRRQGIADEYLHYVFNLTVQAWSFWRNVPSYGMAIWQQSLYFVDPEVSGNLWKMTGSLDNVITGDSDLSEARGIEFSILSSYQNFGLPGLHKIPDMIRAVFQANQSVGYNARLLTNYDLDEITTMGISVSQSDNDWDSGNWDSAIWQQSDLISANLGGASGLGRQIAFALRGTVQERTTLLEVDVSFRAGGFL